MSLEGQKRTLNEALLISASDPKRTCGGSFRVTGKSAPPIPNKRATENDSKLSRDWNGLPQMR